MFKHLLVGVDGSPGSLRAMDVAAVMAAEHAATLAALTVIDRDPRFAATVGEVDEELAAGETYAQKVRRRCARSPPTTASASRQ
jgi:nucleotide-binding universal stress UspA family protein